MSNLYWLTDAQMERLKPFLPKSHGKPRVDDRRVLSGIIFINRNGLRWCDGEDGAAIGSRPIRTRNTVRRRPSTSAGSAGATTGSSPGSWWAWPLSAPNTRRS